MECSKQRVSYAISHIVNIVVVIVVNCSRMAIMMCSSGSSSSCSINSGENMFCFELLEK